jgi:hypothetical protein
MTIRELAFDQPGVGMLHRRDKAQAAETISSRDTYCDGLNDQPAGEAMNRRRFLAGGVAACVLNGAPRFLVAQSAAVPATLALDTEAPRIALPAEYTGLSYESAQLANPGYFSRSNTRLVTLVRQLGAKGVLRLGGSTSDYDRWNPARVQRGASWSEPANPDNGQGETVRAAVTETAIDELRGFLDATGWTAIYGVDLGHGSPEAAADEAAYVVKKLGRGLIALQIGNEPDLFSRDIRKSSYGYTDYFKEWQSFAAAIRRRTPDAPLAGPDITDEIGWVDQFAREAAGISMLTSHYYAEGPPESPDSDIKHLLQPQPDLMQRMRRVVNAGKSAHLPYRMSEGNSCYNGGKAGVSDSFASALWGADFMLLLAQTGVAGINFHGGGQGFYTPIAGGGSTPLEARPLYYGMLFYREFAAGSLIPCRLDAGGVNATAYACLNARGRLALAIINKDLQQDLHLSLRGDVFLRPSRTIALQAPSAESRTGIHLGGQSLAGGSWHPVYSQRNRSLAVQVPKTCAMLIEFEGVTL